MAVCDLDCEAMWAAASEYGCAAALDAASDIGTDVEVETGRTPVTR